MASSSAQLQANDSMNAALTKMNRNISSVTVSYERLLAVSAKGIGIGALNQSCVAAERMEMSFQNCAESVEDAEDKQKGWNASIEAAKGKAAGLVSNFKKLVKAIDVKKLVDMSNEFAQSEARLSLIVDDNGSVDALRGKIYAAAQASGADYAGTMNTVTRLGQLAGDAFGGNDELVRFTELMNKGFAIGGVPAEKQSGVMDTITKAMASGGLDSGSYADIVENAPILAESIETYMRASGVTGTMEEWMSKGMVTAEVIKNAMFLSADTIDERFGQMPKTWAGIWTDIKNRATLALTPVLEKINELANDAQVQAGIDMMMNGFANLVNFAMNLFQTILGIAAFFYENWSLIGPIVWGIVAAFLAWKIAVFATSIALGIQAAVQAINAAATGANATATSSAAAAQSGFNAALYACPILWMILLVLGLVLAFYVVIAAINHMTGSTISATGIICGAFAFVAASIMNLIVTVWNVLVDVGVLIFNLIADLCNFLGNVFDDPIGAVCHLFVDLADFVLGILQTLAGAIDTLFGSNFAGTIQGWRDGIQGWADETFGVQRVFVERRNADELKGGFTDPFAAWDAGYAFGEGIEKEIGGLFDFGGIEDPPENTWNFTPSTGGIPPYEELTDNTGAIAGNTGAIAENTAKSGDDLKLLREIAEREAINRFTTAEVKVDMTGMSNTIASDMDIDGFINIFTQRFEAALVSTAEGVHV